MIVLGKAISQVRNHGHKGTLAIMTQFAAKSGYAAALGIGLETTYGTAVVPSLYLPIESAQANPTNKLIDRSPIRKSKSQQIAGFGQFVSSGQLELRAEPITAAQLIAYVLGKDTVTAASGAQLHTITMTNSGQPTATVSIDYGTGSILLRGASQRSQVLLAVVDLGVLGFDDRREQRDLLLIACHGVRRGFELGVEIRVSLRERLGRARCRIQHAASFLEVELTGAAAALVMRAVMAFCAAATHAGMLVKQPAGEAAVQRRIVRLGLEAPAARSAAHCQQDRRVHRQNVRRIKTESG